MPLPPNCYLLAAIAEHRDEDAWGCHILDAVDQGLDPERTIADFGSGQRAGHKAVFGEEVPCHGDAFHLQHQWQSVVSSLNRQAGATTQRQALEQEMIAAKQKPQGHRLSRKLSWKFHPLCAAVQEAMKQTPRASSLVENLSSRLRNYFFLHKRLGPSYQNLLQFFLNHRQFMHSEHEGRVDKSPK